MQSLLVLLAPKINCASVLRARENREQFIAAAQVFFCGIVRHARAVVLRALPRKGLALLEEEEAAAEAGLGLHCRPEHAATA